MDLTAETVRLYRHGEDGDLENFLIENVSEQGDTAGFIWAYLRHVYLLTLVVDYYRAVLKSIRNQESGYQITAKAESLDKWLQSYRDWDTLVEFNDKIKEGKLPVFQYENLPAILGWDNEQEEREA